MSGKCMESCVAVPGVKQDWVCEAGMGEVALWRLVFVMKVLMMREEDRTGNRSWKSVAGKAVGIDDGRRVH